MKKYLKKLEIRNSKFEKILLIILFFILISPSAKADSSFQIKIDDVLNKKNIFITQPDTNEKYLLYLGTGCSVLTKGQNVTLVVKGSLNGGDDTIKEDTIHQCNIERADVFTNKLYVSTVFGDNTKAYVQDENKNEYYISFGSKCASIAGYKNDYVYAFQADATLAKSDRIIIPDKGGQCSIYYLELNDQSKSKNATNTPDKVPTDVTGVKPFPRNGGVFLVWKPAKDDKGIAYYVIGYNHSRLNTKDVMPENIPNMTKIKSAHITLTGLENDQPYYFYVTAVDSGGNASSNWSEGVFTTPKSSIMQDSTATSSVMKIRISGENANSFLIRWAAISGSRQIVIFEVDGKREFVKTEYIKNNISISKKSEYKEKKLSLTVRATDIRGATKEEKLNFDF